MVSEEILKFSTQKSVFSEIVFEIDKVLFVCRKLIPEVMITHYEYEMNLKKMGEKGDPYKVQELIVKHLLYLFPEVKEETLIQLEDDEIRMIMNQVVISQMLNRQLINITETVKKAVRKSAVKNGRRPGKKGSQK
jgi:hypothetical protein